MTTANPATTPPPAPAERHTGGTVGRRIAHCRAEAGLSVVQLAHAVGADPACARDAEQGAFSPSTALLLRIASVLGVPLGDLRGQYAHLPEGRSAAAPALVLPHRFRWEFDENGLMRHRYASINDLPISADERRTAL